VSTDSKKIASSPERHTFQAESYVKRCEEEGTEPSEDYLNMYKSRRQQDAENLVNPKWQKNNLEYDLRSTEWICQKAKASQSYAQNLYAAMCNMRWCKLDTVNVLEILKDSHWSCSWRYAGGIVADMLEQGDYIDWYCSGIRDIGFNNDAEEAKELTEEQRLRKEMYDKFVSESVVTDEIAGDLRKLGWVPIEWDEDSV
jgi:hypothetical protein